MNQIKLSEITKYVQTHIKSFHDSRLKSLEEAKLKDLLKKKNPYLFRAKNILTAQELVTSFLDAKLSSSEEEIFGEFLEGLAIFVAHKTLNASKSSTTGIDLEYETKEAHYLINIKSGLSWGNADQWRALRNNFEVAINDIKSRDNKREVKCFIASCYGKAKTTLRKGMINLVCGQTFWCMISDKPSFYTDIIEPIGHKAKEFNEEFKIKKSQIINKFTKEFLNEFCDKDGKILWGKLVKFNSGNL